MPPKNSNKATVPTVTPTTTETLEDVIRVLTGLSNQFTAFHAKFDTVDISNNTLTSMEAKLSAVEAKLVISMNEYKQLRAELNTKNKIIDDLHTSFTGLEVKCNDLEQYNLSLIVRINNILLTCKEEKSNSNVCTKV
jgi:septal ring factor EnvC (AmiA/AmiB activator)